VSLAHAILWDVLGVKSSQSVAVVFAGDVIARLPEDSFSLSEQEVRHWLDARDPPRMSADELVEHLGSLALAEPEEEAVALRKLVDRCWTVRSLVN